MTAYDPLIDYLKKNTWVDQKTALTLLSNYKHTENAYRALSDKVQQKVLERKIEDGITWYRLRVVARPMPQRLDDEEIFMLWPKLYCYFVRYGAQHFSAPGRIKFMSILRLWIEKWRRQIQFAALLIDLIDNEPSKSVYMELDEGLQQAGWYENNTNPVDMIDTVVSWLNPEKHKNFLSISDQSWASLKDYDGLSRIKEEPEQASGFDKNSPYFQSEFETEEEFKIRQPLALAHEEEAMKQLMDKQ